MMTPIFSIDLSHFFIIIQQRSDNWWLSSTLLDLHRLVEWVSWEMFLLNWEIWSNQDFVNCKCACQRAQFAYAPIYLFCLLLVMHCDIVIKVGFSQPRMFHLPAFLSFWIAALQLRACTFLDFQCDILHIVLHWLAPFCFAYPLLTEQEICL